MHDLYNTDLKAKNLVSDYADNTAPTWHNEPHIIQMKNLSSLEGLDHDLWELMVYLICPNRGRLGYTSR